MIYAIALVIGALILFEVVVIRQSKKALYNAWKREFERELSTMKETKYFCTTCMPKFEYTVSDKEVDYKLKCDNCGRDSFCIGIHLKSSPEKVSEIVIRELYDSTMTPKAAVEYYLETKEKTEWLNQN